jgi:hypothetical protein
MALHSFGNTMSAVIAPALNLQPVTLAIEFTIRRIGLYRLLIPLALLLSINMTGMGMYLTFKPFGALQ